MSLRPSQEESLNLLAELVEQLTLQKDSELAEELKKVRSRYPTCQDFEQKRCRKKKKPHSITANTPTPEELAKTLMDSQKFRFDPY